MSGLIIGRGYVAGLGECYIEQGDRAEFLLLRNIKTGFAYYRNRRDVSWRPAQHKGV